MFCVTFSVFSFGNVDVKFCCVGVVVVVVSLGITREMLVRNNRVLSWEASVEMPNSDCRHVRSELLSLLCSCAGSSSRSFSCVGLVSIVRGTLAELGLLSSGCWRL